MHSTFRHAAKIGIVGAIAIFSSLHSAQAAPPVLRLMPPKNTGFLVDQRMDVRAEATVDSGRTLTNIALSIDGTPVSASPQLFVDLATTQSVTLRKFSFLTAGPHTISVTALDSAGESATLTQSYTVVDPFGTRRPVKNVIILLGDGMGAAHKTAARIVRYGVTEGRANGRLAMDAMPNIASIMTHSLNSIVTDSAPGMQNYVTGSKAQNNQEGVYPDNTSNTAVAGSRTGAFDNPRIEYLGEYMTRKFGKSLGIVTTADVEDATPAANMIHTQDRGAGTGICDQYFDERQLSGLRVLMGGGRRWFLPAGTTGSARSNATDYQLPADLAGALGVPTGALDSGRNLISDFQNDGFFYAPDRTTLNSLAGNSTKLLGLFSFGHMNVALDKVNGRRGILPTGRSTTVVADYLLPDQPMLDEMAQAALTVLDRGNNNGFVLMIEGASIDKQSHGMDADRAIWDTMEFDNAIRRALEFAQNDGNTLVIVTADHECSGFSIIGGIDTVAARAAGSDIATLDPGIQPNRQKANIIGTYDAAAFPNYGTMFSANDSTTPDPLFGYPLDPDPIRKLAIGFGGSGDRYEDWLAEPVPYNDGTITNVSLPSVYPATVTGRAPENSRGMYLRGQASGVGGATAVHTANEIPLYAFSAGSRASQQFAGLLDNTDVFFLLARSLAGGY